MSSSKIPIPQEFQSQLRYVDARDSRSNAEILDSLTKKVPVNSEKNVWTYWHAGVLAMPEWCQRNIINWVKLLGPDWSVRVLDYLPESSNYALSWFAADQLPEGKSLSHQRTVKFSHEVCADIIGSFCKPHHDRTLRWPT